MTYYKLVDQKPVACDMLEAFSIIEEQDRTIAVDLVNGAKISTVFLAIDHGFNDGPPILFETMVFGGKYDGHQERYATWEEAWEGHKIISNMCSNTSNEEPDKEKEELNKPVFGNVERHLDI